MDNFFKDNIENLTLTNEYYRHVLYTGPHLQLVVMTLRPGEEIGEEVHKKGDQFIRVESGRGKFVLDGKEYPCYDGDAVVIPEGMLHNVINTGNGTLKLYVLYSPPEHVDGKKQIMKECIKKGFNRIKRLL